MNLLGKIEKLEHKTLGKEGYNKIAQARYIFRGMLENHGFDEDAVVPMVAENYNVPRHFLTVKASGELKKARKRLAAIHAHKSDAEILPVVVRGMKEQTDASAENVFILSKQAFSKMDENDIKKIVAEVYQVEPEKL